MSIPNRGRRSTGRQKVSAQRSKQRKRGKGSRPVHKRLSSLSYASRVYEALDTPVSLSCYLLLKNREYEQLVRKRILPSDYLQESGESFFRDWQSVNLLAKLESLDTGIDTEAVAVKGFLECEAKCQATNASFRDGTYDRLNGRVDSILMNAARKISTILGRVPELSELDFAFGPGATYGVRGETSAYNKITSILECTPALAHSVQELLEEFPGWIPDGIHDVHLVNGSELVIVSKNAVTGRPICIPTLLGGMAQKGIGSWIRKRLKRFGIDLNDQSQNQRLASCARAQGLATVDFKSCSDLIAYLLVYEVCPIDWATFLDRFREPQYLREGKWYNFHKFSSMGNAYTFELMTTILYGIACACCEELGIEFQTGVNLSVYGDDVVIPQAAFDLFSQVTGVCGFTVNIKKSFFEGVFFESCGHDYFMDDFVRPFQIDAEPNKRRVAFYYANTISRLAARYSALKKSDPYVFKRLFGVYNWCVGCVRPSARLYGPEGYGDGHLVTSSTEGSARDPMFDGWWFKTIVEKPIRTPLEDVPLGYALYSIRVPHKEKPYVLDIREPLHWGSGYSVRGRTRDKTQKVFCPSVWHGVGGVSLDDAHTVTNPY